MGTAELKPNLQDLQKDVIELLGEISKLMGCASETLGEQTKEGNYSKFKRELEQAAKNVKNRELRMAIVAPMSSGKSTIINSIIGQELLPSRNSAMTTLPTEIILDATCEKPILSLGENIRETLEKTVSILKNLENVVTKEGLGEYPHLIPLFENIISGYLTTIPSQIEGHEAIGKILPDLNDLIRLCSILAPYKNPIEELTELPRIFTPFRCNHTSAQSEYLGNLVIVDTPGINEAGDNIRLKQLVDRELEKSSLVLIVLDFTQLKTEAAEKVRQDVKQVVKLRGLENLYVLINKIDQRRTGDMKEDEVRSFVGAEFGLEIQEQVFEISARRAFSAASFLLEKAHYPEREVSEMRTARSLAQEVYGIDWEEDLAEATTEVLDQKAQSLLKKSGFPPFLDESISALMERAAPKSMRSALETARNRLKELNNDIDLRSKAISLDEQELRLQIGALDDDLNKLETCRKRMKEVAQDRSNLDEKLNDILDKLKKSVTFEVEKFFIEEEYQKAGIEKKTLLLFNKMKNVIFQDSYKDTRQIRFEHEALAKNFIDLILSLHKSLVEQRLQEVSPHIKAEVEETRKQFVSQVEKEIKPIIERAYKRLNEAFDLNLDLPSLTLSPIERDMVKPTIQEDKRRIPQEDCVTYEERRDWYHWLWLVPYKKEVRIKSEDKEEAYYTVYLSEIQININEWIEKIISNIKHSINKYFDKDYQNQVEHYFDNLDGYLLKYQDSLKKAQKNQNRSLEEKRGLINTLNTKREKVKEYTQKVERFLENTQDFN